jgi:hypothetical protein
MGGDVGFFPCGVYVFLCLCKTSSYERKLFIVVKIKFIKLKGGTN